MWEDRGNSLNPKYLGDSYDIVKQSLLRWLSALGPWYTHPMFTEPLTPDQTDIYSRLLSTHLLSSKTLTPGTDRNTYIEPARKCTDHVFLDPDIGVRLNPIRGAKAPRYLFSTELIEIVEAGPERLVLVFDQSIARGEERKELENKLKIFAKQGILGIAYVSHACFILMGKNRGLLESAFETLKKESRLPESRFVIEVL